MKIDQNEQLRGYLNELVGMSAWGVVAGAGTGSRATVNFGELIPRIKPLSNPCLDSKTRHYDSKWTLFIENATWRVESPSKVYGSSKSSNETGAEMLNALVQLVGAKVVDTSLFEPSGDIELIFSNEIKLRVFCDCVHDEDGDNYSFFVPDFIFTVKPKGALVSERRGV